MNNTIKCKNCGAEIEVSEALTHQIEEQVLATINERHNRELAETKKQAEQEVSERIQKDYLLRLKELEKEKDEEKERNSKLLKQLEDLSEELRKLRRKDEERELEMKKRLAGEEEKIRQESRKKLEEEHYLKDLEKDKKLQDALKQVEELKNKIQQGSQQTQGEVLEIDLEEKLRSTFIHDEITPVGKGVQGADIIQKVRNQVGKVAGIILWETKRAKWTPSWIAKLREDGRKSDATVTILVCENLPKGVDNFKLIDGVLVTSILYSISLASLLRRSVMHIAAAKSATENKDEKLEMLYQYLQSDAFRHRFEAFAESIKAMEEDLLSERRSMERIWKKRETQLKRMQLNSSRMIGELQGIMDNTLPEVKTLSLPTGNKK